MNYSDAEKVKMFCFQNKMKIKVYENKLDINYKTVLFDAEILKNNILYKLFILYSCDDKEYRIQILKDKKTTSFKNIQSCLNFIKND